MLLINVKHLVLLDGTALGATAVLGGSGARDVPFHVGNTRDERDVVQVEDLGAGGVRDKARGGRIWGTHSEADVELGLEFGQALCERGKAVKKKYMNAAAIANE